MRMFAPPFRFLSAATLASGLTGLAFAAPGCGDDAEHKPFIKEVPEAGTVDASDAADVEVPEPTAWAYDPCPELSSIDGGDAATVVRSLSARESTVLIALEQSVRAMHLLDGCPGERISSFGVDGEVSVVGLRAAALLSGGRALVARNDGLVPYTAAGAPEEKNCEAAGEVRMIATRSDDTGVAGFARSPIVAVSANPCAAVPVELTPAPYAILALGTSDHVEPTGQRAAFVTVEKPQTYAQLVVARYDKSGTRVATSPLRLPEGNAGRICSAAAVVDAGDAGVVVADPTCRKVLWFDAATLQPEYVAYLDGSPSGAALASEQGDAGAPALVMVAVARETRGGARASFVKLTLPTASAKAP